MDQIKYIYTWKDIERIFAKFNKKQEYSFFNEVDVYHDEVIANLNDLSKIEDAKNILKSVLGDHYDCIQNEIKFDLFDKKIPISWEEETERQGTSEVMPLFRDVIYRDTSYTKMILEDTKLEKCPVIAFHSYKGGVGRTLSLLAFMKAWSANSEKKLLIIDSDIEAPGLTWLMSEEYERENQLCYLDILEMIQTSDLNSVDVFEKIVEQMQFQTIKIDNGKVNTEHFFIPTYRYEEQLLDIYASPESIASGYGKQYLLAEKLSELGSRLGASAVLVDLRAGISEFSAPLLFDPRVEKYVVSSTSYQSVKGTQLIIKEICKGLPITANTNIPKILLTMTLDDIDLVKIKGNLLQAYEEQDYTDNIIIELPFASELIHLGRLNQILDKLEDREMYRNIFIMVKEFYMESSAEEKEDRILIEREEMVRKIHELAEKQINAEMNADFNVLMTQPIANLVKKFAKTVPNAVIAGAKGSGKTFLYRELLREKMWGNFCKKYGNVNVDNITYILPLIAPKNFDDMHELLHESLKNFRENNSFASKDEDFWYTNGNLLKCALSENLNLQEWKTVWETCILNSFSKKINQSMQTVEQCLSEKQINVLFVVDGLEEFFENTLDNDNEKYAVRALAQDIMNELKIQYPHIGMITFLRKDVLNNSFTTNKEQFENQYRNYALNWTHDEALRLALWLVNQAVPGVFVDREARIENVSKDVIKEALDKVWGLKLGKKDSNEAYSYRWILAALSDFHAQLQARDIVRFLADATKDVGSETYEDRIIMPREIKKAVQSCSKSKVVEIKQEMKKLKPILTKLENVPESQKVLPFDAGAFGLTVQEENLMQQEGLLKMDGGKYYIPEIIRHALKFKYEKGARPKVLSLLFQ